MILGTTSTVQNGCIHGSLMELFLDYYFGRPTLVAELWPLSLDDEGVLAHDSIFIYC